MKSNLILGIFAVSALILSACNSEKLIFEDNFDKDGIPDPEVWSLCKKGTSEWCNEMSESYDQAYCQDGKLILTAEKKDGRYLAGGIQTLDKFNFTYGRIEVRARITSSPDGAFPAIWMMPYKNGFLYDDGWPNGGEIDIMEHIKQENGIYQTIHSHYTTDLKIVEPKNHVYVENNYKEWNVYGMDWTPDVIRFFVNGEETMSYKNLKLDTEQDMRQWPFDDECSMYPILNMGLGGNPDGWPGPIDDDNLPARMEIDWIKIYRN